MTIPAAFDPFSFITTQVMQTKLPTSIFVQPPGCGPGRSETPVVIKMNGKLYTFTYRDKIVPEDPYLLGVKAAAFSIKRVEEYRGTPPPRTVRDFLIKTNLIT
jgi:hypothetical protein